MNWRYKFLTADLSSHGRCIAIIISTTEVVRIDSCEVGRRGDIDVNVLLSCAHQLSVEHLLPIELALHQANQLTGAQCVVRPIFPVFRTPDELAVYARRMLAL